MNYYRQSNALKPLLHIFVPCGISRETLKMVLNVLLSEQLMTWWQTLGARKGRGLDVPLGKSWFIGAQFVDKGMTLVLRMTWAQDPDEEKKAKEMIVLARCNVEKTLSQLRGVNYVITCITGMITNRYCILLNSCSQCIANPIYL